MPTEENKPILTINVAPDEPQSEAEQTASSFVMPAEEEKASAENETPQSEGGSLSFREVIAQNVHEDDDDTSKVSLVGMLGGDVLTSDVVRKQLWLFILIALFILAYITNRYAYQQKLIYQKKLKTELQEIRYKQRAVSSELTERTRKSKVLDMLNECKDSTLKASITPPYIIRVKNEE